MAYTFPNENRFPVHAPHFADLRTVTPPFPFHPDYFGLGNPNFRPSAPFVKILAPGSRPVVLPAVFGFPPSLLIKMEQQRTQSLLQFMSQENLVPSQDEERQRTDVVFQLKKIVLLWIKKVAWQRRLPKEAIASASAIIVTYGSYALGVHGSESDIDALCVGPSYATMEEDFFVVLHNMLKSSPEVSDIQCVKTANVPLIRFKFNGIPVDLPFMQLPLLTVPENVDFLDPYIIRKLNETHWKRLSGVRVNKCILELVPNLENFRSVLRCVKLWARRRGIYSNLHGFFGGIHLVILVAYVCKIHPNASLGLLISKFFEMFSYWRWPAPVSLLDRHIPSLRESFMPIMMPWLPLEPSKSNITQSTFNKIRNEFERGNVLTRDLGRPDFEWSSLFDPFPYTKRYSQFAKILLTAPDNLELHDWLGWVKSRLRCLLLKLEQVQGFCDPNPTEYVDSEVTEPNTVFYWGLSPSRSSFVDISSVEVEFVKELNKDQNNGYKGSGGRLQLSIVEASKLPKDAQSDSKGTKACWRILEHSQLGRPIYSHHSPYYFLGYVAREGGANLHEQCFN